MAAADTAYRTRKTDDKARRVVLREMADALEAAADRLAPVLTAEQGKPLGDTRGEIFMSVLRLRYYADLEIPREVVQDGHGESGAFVAEGHTGPGGSLPTNTNGGGLVLHPTPVCMACSPSRRS
jgi:acyl-CoA reductase-like NAD-dependent aldehyde dehydrogenase